MNSTEASSAGAMLQSLSVVLAIVALSPVPLALPSGIAVAVIRLIGGVSGADVARPRARDSPSPAGRRTRHSQRLMLLRMGHSGDDKQGTTATTMLNFGLTPNVSGNRERR